MNIAGIMPLDQKAAYLRTLPAIRERCGRVYDLAKQGKLEYFDYHPEKEADVAAFCIDIIKRDYGTDFSSIKPHGRWRHLDAGVGRVRPEIAKWHARHDIDIDNAKSKSSSTDPDKNQGSDHLPSPLDPREELKRAIDLFLVSVLLDAGAGDRWRYHEASSGMTFSRSEGLGVASIHMFDQGFFASEPVGRPYMVDAAGLAKITVERVAEAMQVNEEDNPMVGLEGRASLLIKLADALKAHPEYFGSEGRPGNIIDFLEKESTVMDGDEKKRVLPLSALWHCLIEGLNSIWPARLKLGEKVLGDVWPCEALKKQHSSTPSGDGDGDELVPFHKLTMWITYSLVEVIEKIGKWKVEGVEDLTGLPEYRNGGLLVDLGVLTLKPGVLDNAVNPVTGLPKVPPSHPAIVEWRAMTVVELDRIADAIRKGLELTPEELTLAQVLEGATWKGGREIAKEKRPGSGGPPIEIESDGTVF